MKVFYRIMAVVLVIVLSIGGGLYFGSLGNKVSLPEGDDDCCGYQALHAQSEHELSINQQRLSVLNSQVGVLSEMVNIFVAGGGSSEVFDLALKQIEGMFTQIAALESAISVLTHNNAAHLQQITEQLETIRQLNIQVSNLTQLLAAWDGANRYIVEFKVDDLVTSIQILNPAFDTHATDPEAPHMETWKIFQGWSLDGVNIINVSQHAITDNTTFIAVYILQSFTVQFISNSSVIRTETVVHGNRATAPSVSDTATHRITGWSLNGSTLINVGTTIITGNTTFLAVWTARQWQEVWVQTTPGAPMLGGSNDAAEINFNTWVGFAPTWGSQIQIEIGQAGQFRQVMILSENGTFVSSSGLGSATFNYTYVNGVMNIVRVSTSGSSMHRPTASVLTVHKIDYLL